jgi:hypothetical protein
MNVSVISNTIFFGLGSEVVSVCHLFFCVSPYTMQPHVLWQHSWIGKCFFLVAVLCNVSRLRST